MRFIEDPVRCGLVTAAAFLVVFGTAVVGILAVAACSAGQGPVAEIGDSVAVHYHGTLDDGSVFDSSRERSPIEFVIGSGQLIEGFDMAVRGLAVGESVTVRLEPEQAYGQPDPNLIVTLPRDESLEGIVVGAQAQMSNGMVVTVTEVTDETVTVDANHRLAGQALTFEIELVEIY